LKFESKRSICHCEQAARHNKTVIARLDRAIQYRETVVFNREAAACWIARSSRAKTAEFVSNALTKFDGYAGQARV
jgi:hypothetical protein